ncbi:pyridoxal phosphate-dependent aminotransferase [Nocardia sp. NPDC004278]
MNAALDLARPAARLAEITPSSIRAIFDRASELERTGERVIHLEIGRPDFDTPDVAKQHAIQAIADGKVHYGPNSGLLELREALSRYLGRRHGLRYRPEDELLVTIGANEAVFLAMMAFCGPGDEVVVPVPAWSAYVACVRLAGATPVLLPLRAENGYQVDPDELASVITPRTRMVVLCTPHNPTGAVTDPERLAQIGEALHNTRALLLSDEIYGELVYTGHRHVSPASLGGLRHRTLVVGGFAKAYAMDGWRLGWLAGPPELIRPALRIRQFTTICPTTFAQLGAAAALEEADADREAMRQEFERRRSAALDLLTQQNLLSPGQPHGTFYLYLSYPERLGPSDEIAWELLEEHRVAVVPGTAFGADSGKHALRISYACGIEDLREGLTRVITAMADRGGSRSG